MWTSPLMKWPFQGFTVLLPPTTWKHPPPCWSCIPQYRKKLLKELIYSLLQISLIWSPEALKSKPLFCLWSWISYVHLSLYRTIGLPLPFGHKAQYSVSKNFLFLSPLAVKHNISVSKIFLSSLLACCNLSGVLLIKKLAILSFFCFLFLWCITQALEVAILPSTTLFPFSESFKTFELSRKLVANGSPMLVATPPTSN